MWEMQSLLWKIGGMVRRENQFVEGGQIVGRETFYD